MAAEPVGAGRAAVRAHTGVADEPGPVRENVRARDGARRQVLAQESPGMQLRRKAAGQAGDVKQHRFAAFLDSEVAKAGSIDARGTQQLRRGAEPVEIIGVLTEAEGDADFFVGHGG